MATADMFFFGLRFWVVLGKSLAHTSHPSWWASNWDQIAKIESNSVQHAHARASMWFSNVAQNNISFFLNVASTAPKHAVAETSTSPADPNDPFDWFSCLVILTRLVDISILIGGRWHQAYWTANQTLHPEIVTFGQIVISRKTHTHIQSEFHSDIASLQWWSYCLSYFRHRLWHHVFNSILLESPTLIPNYTVRSNAAVPKWYNVFRFHLKE